MKYRNVVAVIVAIFALSLGFMTSASAGPEPMPSPKSNPSSTDQTEAQTRTAQESALLATAVPLDQIPAPKLLSEARPYGGERFGIETNRTTGETSFCSVGYNGVSLATGAQYVLTAGHCGRLTDAATGRFFYPVCAALFNCPVNAAELIGDTGSRWRFDTGGDFAAVRANVYTSLGKTLVRKLRQPANGRIDTVAHAADPVLAQTASVYAGNSQQVYTGFYSFVDQTVTFSDGTVAGNMAIIQAPRSAPTTRSPDGCAVGGDSGSSTASASSGGLLANGILSASSIDATHCFLFVTQLASAMQLWGLGSAPAAA
jgi:hypothetical protein